MDEDQAAAVFEQLQTRRDDASRRLREQSDTAAAEFRTFTKGMLDRMFQGPAEGSTDSPPDSFSDEQESNERT